MRARLRQMQPGLGLACAAGGSGAPSCAGSLVAWAFANERAFGAAFEPAFGTVFRKFRAFGEGVLGSPGQLRLNVRLNVRLGACIVQNLRLNLASVGAVWAYGRGCPAKGFKRSVW